jgi:hypothetical protein
MVEAECNFKVSKFQGFKVSQVPEVPEVSQVSKVKPASTSRKIHSSRSRSNGIVVFAFALQL